MGVLVSSSKACWGCLSVKSVSERLQGSLHPLILFPRTDCEATKKDAEPAAAITIMNADMKYSIIHDQRK